jgi:hypothetical protein
MAANFMKFRKGLGPGGSSPNIKSKAPLGEGGRFVALKSTLAGRPGVTNPGALAASIGRKKYGKAKMQSMAAAGRRQSMPVRPQARGC